MPEREYSHIEGILPKGPFLSCVSMAGTALLAGYHRYDIDDTTSNLVFHGTLYYIFLDFTWLLNSVLIRYFFWLDA